MLSLSQTTGHAVRALAYLAEHALAPALISDIAKEANVPKAYLAKIVKKLNDAGIVASKRGQGGGVWLARPASQISLLDISDALDGESYLQCCLLGESYCTDERACPTHRFWKAMRGKIREELRRTSLADVLTFYEKQAARAPSDTAPETINNATE